MHYYLLCVAFSPLLFTYFGVSHTCGSGKCAGHVRRSVPRPKLSSWERKCSTTTLPGWGEPAGERSSSWSHHWNSIADAQVFHRRFSTEGFPRWPVLRGSGQVSVPPREWRGAGVDQACVYSQPWINLSSSMFLLIPAGSHAAVVQ